MQEKKHLFPTLSTAETAEIALFQPGTACTGTGR